MDMFGSRNVNLSFCLAISLNLVNANDYPHWRGRQKTRWKDSCKREKIMESMELMKADALPRTLSHILACP